MSGLKGKTVLLLAPQFFGYELEIKKGLEKLGAQVVFFDERPKNDFITKVLIRLNFKSLISRKINSYFDHIIFDIKYEKIDYLFLISPESININKINKIKQDHKDIKIIVYFWDSIKNSKNALKYLDISDRYFTFDSSDKKINKKIRFLPLFYINDYQVLDSKPEDYIYDICFIGTAHTDRYNTIKKIEEQVSNSGYRLFYYFYSPSKILFFFQKIFNRKFKSFSWKDISFESLDKTDVVDIVNKSKSVVDIHHPDQTGLTMRTIEILGAKRKMFTTNVDVKSYDFFNSANISIFDRNFVNLDLSILDEKYCEIDKDVYKSYSLSSWLNKIFF